MSRKYCEEYTKVMRLCVDIIENNMMREIYTTIPYNSYKDGCRALARLVDVLERFVPAN